MKDLLRGAVAQGRADALTLLAQPARVEDLPLGDFGAGGAEEAALRQVLHALRVPPAVVGKVAERWRGSKAARMHAVAARYAYWHAARQCLNRETWKRLTHGTAILMYHAFGAPPEPASRFVLPQRSFRRQLQAIKRRPVLSLGELARARVAGRLAPAGAVVITIDDAFADCHGLAAPLLRRFGAPATVFAISDRVGRQADWDGAGELAGRRLLDWQGLAELGRDGLEIGAHTQTHPRLPELPADEASAEIAGSREALSTRLGVDVDSFCYPYGRLNEDVVAAVERAGFACACGIERGLNYPNTPLHRLRRVPIDGDASMLRFAVGVRFGDPDLLARLFERLRATLARLTQPRTRGDAVRP
jgi:peptidoglycan/xylan/chitin deacetylase (PgdA/CDA1 family)